MGRSVVAGLLVRSEEVRCPVSGFRWYVPSGDLVWNLGGNDTTLLLVVGMVLRPQFQQKIVLFLHVSQQSMCKFHDSVPHV